MLLVCLFGDCVAGLGPGGWDCSSLAGTWKYCRSPWALWWMLLPPPTFQWDQFLQLIARLLAPREGWTSGRKDSEAPTALQVLQLLGVETWAAGGTLAPAGQQCSQCLTPRARNSCLGPKDAHTHEAS